MTTNQNVAIYCRISDDRTGRGENVGNQEAWGREYAAKVWPDLPVRIYVDNDITASKRGVHLPERERLRSDIAKGEIAHVWTVEQSRLQRREGEWFILADEFEDAGITELHTRRDGVFPIRDIKAGIQAVLNAEESRKLSKRVTDDMAEHAAKGGIPGGTVYGYRRITIDGVKKLEIVEDQAAIIREVADKVLAGETQTSIANDLHSRGITGPRGGRIWQSTVHSMVTNHTVAGKRLHDPGSTGDGKVYPGSWEPILDEVTWQRVRDRLGETRIGIWKSTRPSRYKHDTLLNGIVSCEDCPKGGNRYYMVAHNKNERRAGGKRVRVLYYCCRLCGRGINAAAVDEHVEARLLERIDGLIDLRTPYDKNRADEIEAELERIEHDRASWGVMLAEGKMAAETVIAAERHAADRVKALEAERRDMPKPDEALDPEEVRVAWDGGRIVERREDVSRFVDRVTIAARREGFRGRLDLSRVKMHGHGWEDEGKLAQASSILRLGHDRWTRAMERFREERQPDMSAGDEIALLERCIDNERQAA